MFKTTLRYLNKDQTFDPPRRMEAEIMPTPKERVFESHTRAKRWLKSQRPSNLVEKIVDRPVVEEEL